MNKKLIEIFPYGITFSPDQNRPIMLFKDESEQKVLPVWLSPLDAGITIHQNAVELGYSSSPYSLTWKILKPLGIFLRKCVFRDVKGHQQYVDLIFEGHPKLTTLKSRADEAVAFCLSNKTQFYCEPDYFDKCRVIDAEKNSVGIDQQKNPQRFRNNHPYLN
ncbi:MAG: bifunctional nuclease family protein [Bdellovibrionales bacterium]|nr:bifunctional nuclease family protein [Bdellovibrionales bacterium]